VRTKLQIGALESWSPRRTTAKPLLVYSTLKSMSKTKVIIICALLFWTGCTKQQTLDLPEYLKDLEEITVYPANTESETSIELVREVIFSDTDEVILGRTAGIVVDKDGRVYVGDQHANTVHVFDSDGFYLRQIGRQGEGPGEFLNILDIQIGDNFLHVQCNLQGVIHAFSLDNFELVYTTSLLFGSDQLEELSGWSPNIAFIKNDETYLVQFYRPIFEISDDNRSQRLYTVSNEGDLNSDLLLEMHWGGEYLTDINIPTVLVVPYGRTTLLAVLEESFYTLWTEDLVVKKYDSHGNYISAFYHPVRKKDLRRGEVMEQISISNDHQRHLFRNSSLPEKWPAVQHFLMDDEQRFWISVIIDDRNNYEWWVLKETGELIDRFIWPREKEIQFVKNGKIYVLETDQESGLDQIVRYRINLQA
jgi:hypothetical protein